MFRLGHEYACHVCFDFAGAICWVDESRKFGREFADSKCFCSFTVSIASFGNGLLCSCILTTLFNRHDIIYHGSRFGQPPHSFRCRQNGNPKTRRGSPRSLCFTFRKNAKKRTSTCLSDRKLMHYHKFPPFFIVGAFDSFI